MDACCQERRFSKRDGDGNVAGGLEAREVLVLGVDRLQEKDAS